VPRNLRLTREILIRSYSTLFGTMLSSAYVVAACGILWVAKALHNVYFHPLSRYPGSKVAAISTSWWEWYWNYYRNGRLLFEVERLHQKHGKSLAAMKSRGA
jgi:hypothetical protein